MQVTAIEAYNEDKRMEALQKRGMDRTRQGAYVVHGVLCWLSEVGAECVRRQGVRVIG